MIWLLWLPVTLAAPGVFPLVDPGLFVISGVRTCGAGAGYCLLGLDCTLDEDFLPDTGEGQHCEGLRSAFTPSAHFVCCRAANYKPPTVSVTTPLDVLENEVGNVLQKVAESVEAAQRTPAPGAELRDSESEGSTLLEKEVMESSIEGGVLQGEEDVEEMQHDEEYSEQDNSSVDEELYQNDSPSETIDVLQEAKKEDSSEEQSTEEKSSEDKSSEDQSSEDTSSEDKSTEDNSTEENTVSSESSDEESSSSQEVGSDEVSVTTNKSDPKTPPSPERPSVSETQNDLKGSVHEEVVENNTEGEVTSSDEDSREESETTTARLEEDVTEELMSKETLSAVDETNLDDFQRDENTKEPATEVSNSTTKEATDKNASIEKFAASKDQTTDLNATHANTELSYSKPIKINTKPGKIPTNAIEGSKTSSEDVSLNEVVSSTATKNAEENSLHNAIYNADQQSEEGIRTNKTNTNSHTDAIAGFGTGPSVYPDEASGRPASQGQAGGVCSRSRPSNCSREIKFEFQNRTLCFGSVYALDWVVTSASCALRVFRAGMLNVTVAPLEGAVEAAVKTIVVHESYAENAGLSGQNMEANNIGLVQLRVSMREWVGCVSCLPQPGQHWTSNCSAVTDRPMAPTHKCAAAESCKSSRGEEGADSGGWTSCQGRARDLKDDLGFHYLTLACDTLWQPRFSEPPHGSGAPLFCGDVLAGLEASAGMGLMVYTPVVRYLDWLRTNTNTRSSGPDQHFNLH